TAATTASKTSMQMASSALTGSHLPTSPRSVVKAASAPAGFTAAVTVAPAEGATVSGIVVLEVRGSGMANVELLPATGYTPKYGVFTIPDNGTVAQLNFDTRTLTNGPIQVRISAFNRPAGDPTASEIVAMPVRTWNINNAAPAPFTAAVVTAPV